MTDTQIKRWTWASSILILLAGLAGVLAAADYIPAGVRQFAALGVALLGVASRWCEQQLPPRKEIAAKPPASGAAGPIAILAIVAALAMPACPNALATAYRTHAVLVTARDGAGETLAATQRAAMVKCEAEHKPPAENWRLAMVDCYKRVRAPVAAWVQHVRPAITAALAAFWLALEASYVAGDKALDKAGKAAAGACAALKAAEVGLTQYRDKLGSIGETVLAAVAAGKVLVCR